MNIFCKLLKNISSVPVIVILFFSLLPSANASEITDGVKKTIDTIIEIVSSEDLRKDENYAEKRRMVLEIIGKKFNYHEMTRRALAKHWKERTQEEKEEFIILFGKLLENSYANKIENYTDEKILYVDEKVRGNIALVKTVIRKDGDEIPVDYKLIKLQDGWQIYDFIVEGVSMVRNYRAQFKKIIHRSSYQELVKKLKKKVENISSEKGEKSDHRNPEGGLDNSPVLIKSYDILR